MGSWARIARAAWWIHSLAWAAMPPSPVSCTPVVSGPRPAVAGWRPAPRITTSVSTLLVAADLGGVVEVADHVVPVVPQPRPLQGRGGHPGSPAGFRPGLRAAQQRFGRDARPVGALAADQLPLDHRHPPPGLQQPPRGGLPARAHPDDDHIRPVHPHLLIRVHLMSLGSSAGRPAAPAGGT